jgi:thiamine-phosphate pyrophosphorylase
LELATRLREWTLAAGVLFIVNDRPDLAAIVGADGVHLGQDDLPIAKVRRIVGSNALIGVSTHSIEQARQAVLEGADYLGVGPVFASNTKAFTEFPGLDYVRKAAVEIRTPWFAIGGISLDNIGEVTTAGATRVAVSSAIGAAADPASAARELRARLQSNP